LDLLGQVFLDEKLDRQGVDVLEELREDCMLAIRLAT
jgi:hypothetical protein